MKKSKNVEDFLDQITHFKEEVQELINILRKSGLEEEIKWGMPTYCHQGKHVVGLGSFKNHCAIWFFQGVFLSDPYKVLVNAQDGKTQALRQWRFQSLADIDERRILEYTQESLQNHIDGKVWKVQPKPLVIPEDLQVLIDKDEVFSKAFHSFTPGKKKEFAEYVDSAKRETTRQNRLEKIYPLILSGVGLNDKYRK